MKSMTEPFETKKKTIREVNRGKTKWEGNGKSKEINKFFPLQRAKVQLSRPKQG